VAIAQPEFSGLFPFINRASYVRMYVETRNGRFAVTFDNIRNLQAMRTQVPDSMMHGTPGQMPIAVMCA
jgi:hypothetical protein